MFSLMLLGSQLKSRIQKSRQANLLNSAQCLACAEDHGIANSYLNRNTLISTLQTDKFSRIWITRLIPIFA